MHLQIMIVFLSVLKTRPVDGPSSVPPFGSAINWTDAELIKLMVELSNHLSRVIFGELDG